jgi:hypothetical protein
MIRVIRHHTKTLTLFPTFFPLILFLCLSSYKISKLQQTKKGKKFLPNITYNCQIIIKIICTALLLMLFASGPEET